MRAEAAARYCCVRCFGDQFLVEFVRKQGTLRRGPCDFCGATKQRMVPPEELAEIFARPLRVYFQPTYSQTQGAVINVYEEGAFLGDIVQEYLQPFSDQVAEPRELADAILEGCYIRKEGYEFPQGELYSHIEDDWTHRTDDDYFSELERAVERYGHALHLDADPIVGDIGEAREAYGVLRQSLERAVARVPEKTRLWRARIGSQHRGKKIAAPPPERAGLGRANLPGQPFLYLADSPETAVVETRPALGDTVSVAPFRLKRTATLVDLRPLKAIPSAFKDVQSYDASVREAATRRVLGAAYGAPVRTGDAARDYLLTQYVAQMARGRGFDGLIFPSSQSSVVGVNYVFFDPEVAVPIRGGADVVVAKVEYSFSGLPKRV